MNFPAKQEKWPQPPKRQQRLDDKWGKMVQGVKRGKTLLFQQVI
jgi:hypothetical protein